MFRVLHSTEMSSKILLAWFVTKKTELLPNGNQAAMERKHVGTCPRLSEQMAMGTKPPSRLAPCWVPGAGKGLEKSFSGCPSLRSILGAQDGENAWSLPSRAELPFEI